MDYKFTLENKTDEEIIKIIRGGNEDAINIIIDRYKTLVNSKANRYFIYGSEPSDVSQEGMIGLYNAIKNFDIDGSTTFKTFANICIERQLFSAIKTANRQKHFALNNAVSLSFSCNNDWEDQKDIINIIKNENIEDPLETVIDNEYRNSVKKAIYQRLSSKEKNVLKEYVKGKSYLEIAEKLNCNTKSVDTALTRIRKKATQIQQNYYNDML